MSAPSENGPPPRLNPFAFPSDTDFRFVLLVASILGSCLYMYNWLFNVLPGTGKALVETATRCLALGPRPSDAGSAIEGLLRLSVRQTPEQGAFLASSEAYSDCIAPYFRALALWMIGGVGLVWVLAFVIYWVFPRWKIWRGHLVPMTADDVPEVLAYLGELSTEAGLARAPTFVWNPLNQAPTGVAFGRLGRYYVALTGGLVRTFYTDRPLFRGVMLHELAHLRNADVDKTYLSVAVTIAFAFAALTPFSLVLARESADTILQLFWRLAVLVGLVTFSFCAVLRARETYADLRASTGNGDAEGLRRVLAALPRSRVGRWRRQFRLHPDPEQRIAALDSTDALFRPAFWQAFATGLAVAIAAPNVHNLVVAATLGVQQTVLAPLVAGIVFGPLVVGVVGLQVWRAVFAARVRGHPAPTVAPLAVGLAAGLALAHPLSLRSAIGPTNETNLAASFVFVVLWGGLALVGLLLFLRWIVGVASTWLDASFNARSPRPSYVFGLTVASGVLAVWFAILFFLREMGEIVPLGPASAGSLAAAMLLVVGVPPVVWWLLPQPVTLAAVLSVWALPLAVWLWRSREPSPPRGRWVFLDSTASHPALAQIPRPSLSGPLRTAVVAGVIFAGLLLTVRIGSRVAVSAAVRDSDQFKVGFYLSWLAMAVLIETGVAAIVASRAARLPVPQALFAASVAGCLMAASILGLNLLFGGTIDAMFAAQTLWLLVAGGALLVLPAAMAGAWIGHRSPRTSIEAAEPALQPIAR